MKIREGFVLREVADQAIVIATGEVSKEFNGMIKLNSTGKMIWKGIQEGLYEKEISMKLSDIYGIDVHKAEEDTKKMIQQLKEAGFLVL